MPVTQALTGNYAVAQAARLAGVEMVGFFPIGPSDEVAEEVARLVRRGQMQATIMDLQNERSVMNALILAAEAGIRTLFGTNSEGLFFGAEQIKHAAPARLPLVIAVANRALEPPLIVTPDYQDSVSFRDCQWLQFYCENPQDVLDTTIQAYRVAEDPAVMLPAFVCYEGWEISHSTFTCSVPDAGEVQRFVPPYRRAPEDDVLRLDYRAMYGDGRTVTIGEEGVGADDYMERRYRLMSALDGARTVIGRASAEYARMTGRDWGGVLEAVDCDDAEVVVVTMGAITATARLAVRVLREEGWRIGLVKIRTFRPFPHAELRRCLERARAVVVLERDVSGAVTQELRSALYGLVPAPRVLGRIAGIGGRDVTLDDIAFLAEEGFRAATGAASEEFGWHFGLRPVAAVSGGGSK
jgi:pyruvate/2-oxoacid:ferredoxin oxidoreductase alpha subunit